MTAELAVIETIESLHAVLDSDPSRGDVRYMLADEYRLIGDDVTADGLEWLAREGKWPKKNWSAFGEGGDSFDWSRLISKEEPHNKLPSKLFDNLEGHLTRHHHRGDGQAERTTRRLDRAESTASCSRTTSAWSIALMSNWGSTRFFGRNLN